MLLRCEGRQHRIVAVRPVAGDVHVSFVVLVGG